MKLITKCWFNELKWKVSINGLKIRITKFEDVQNVKKQQLADRCQNRMIEHKIKKFFDNLFIYGNIGMKVIPNNINNSQNAF